MWTRTAHCSATLSATLSSLASEVPTQAGKQPLQTCRATRRDGLWQHDEEPWPKPVDDSQKARIPARRALHPSPKFPRLRFPNPKEYSVDGVSTTKQATQVVQQFGAESVKQTPKKSGSSSPFVCALPTTSGDPGVVVFCCEPGPVIANVLELSEKICSFLFAVLYVQQARSLSVFPRSPVRSSAVPRSDTDEKDVNQWASPHQSDSQPAWFICFSLQRRTRRRSQCCEHRCVHRRRNGSRARAESCVQKSTTQTFRITLPVVRYLFGGFTARDFVFQYVWSGLKHQELLNVSANHLWLLWAGPQAEQ